MSNQPKNNFSSRSDYHPIETRTEFNKTFYLCNFETLHILLEDAYQLLVEKPIESEYPKYKLDVTVNYDRLSAELVPVVLTKFKGETVVFYDVIGLSPVKGMSCVTFHNLPERFGLISIREKVVFSKLSKLNTKKSVKVGYNSGNNNEQCNYGLVPPQTKYVMLPLSKSINNIRQTTIYVNAETACFNDPYSMYKCSGCDKDISYSDWIDSPYMLVRDIEDGVSRVEVKYDPEYSKQEHPTIPKYFPPMKIEPPGDMVCYKDVSKPKAQPIVILSEEQKFKKDVIEMLDSIIGLLSDIACKD